MDCRVKRGNDEEEERKRSPDERSDIRGRPFSFYAYPGFRFAHPGYEQIV